jgi:hypothetical protein
VGNGAVSERDEMALVDHATRLVHRAAVGWSLWPQMHTQCGITLEAATVGAHWAVANVLTAATDCAECWPEP